MAASSAAAATLSQKAAAQPAAAEPSLLNDTSEGPVRPAKLSVAGRAAAEVAARSRLSLEHSPAQALRQPEQGTEPQAQAAAAPQKQLPAPHDSVTPATSLPLAAQLLCPSMQRGTAGPQQALGLPPLRHGEAGQPDATRTEQVHLAAGQVTAARPAGSPRPPIQSQAPSPWPQSGMASLADWHQPTQPPDTVMQKPAAQAQGRGLAEESAAQAAFSFAPPQGYQPGHPQQWWVLQWAQLPASYAMQYQQSASRQAGGPVAGSLEQAGSGHLSAATAALYQLRTGHNMFAAGVTAGAPAHGSPAGPPGQHVAARPALHQQGGASRQTPGPQQQDRAGTAGQLPAGNHRFSHDSHNSSSSDPSCPANSSMAAGLVPARLPGYPGLQASMQQREPQRDSTLQQQAAKPSKALPAQTLAPQEMPVVLHQTGHNQSMAGAAWQQLRHSSSLTGLQCAAATAAAGTAAGGFQARLEDPLHCALASSGRHGSAAEHSHKISPQPQTGGRNSADVSLHRAGSGDLEAAAQDSHQQSQHRDTAGAATAAKTSPGPAFEQGTSGGLPAAGQAASQDQEQLTKLHSGWWQQLAAAGGPAPSPRGVMPGQPPRGQGQPSDPPQSRVAGQPGGPVGTRAGAPVSDALQAALPSHQALAPASQVAHLTGQPAPQQAPGGVPQADGLLLQQPEEGGAADLNSLAEAQGSLAKAPGRLQAQQSSPPRPKSAAEVLPQRRATEVLPGEGGLGATSALAGADVEAAVVGPLWQQLPKEPMLQMRGELHS